MKINIKKLRLAIILNLVVLFILWVGCLITGNYLELIIENEKLLKISKFIDDREILKTILKFCLYYLNQILILYAIFQKRILSYKPIVISIFIFCLWFIKHIFVDYEFTNYLDFVSIAFVCIIDKTKLKNGIIGYIIMFIVSFLSVRIKSFLGVKVQELPFILQTILMIDMYIMSNQYYLYSLKKGVENNERL